ncbi:MAG TPA: heparan-alpha-glucosaminide N-acetyltransferase domain-containing protein [Chitinophagaceae bacterium]|nr:heparan-alpha-glucosaminide N-acetyltransferase domain-containing protein [Chitinophagaceae bacterium]
MKRITSIDAVRGFVMIIMALDHVRDLMHQSSLSDSPTNLATTTPLLFFTRWITYLCAPIFVFLAGTSAYLTLQRRGDRKVYRSFLARRGLVLLLVEFTLVNWALFFDPSFHTFLFEVIATIGTGFLILSLLLNWSPRRIAILGLVILGLHDLVSLVPASVGSPVRPVLNFLFSLGAYPLGSSTALVMAYPPVPWLGILLLGFGTGPWFAKPPEVRARRFTRTGLLALVAFGLLRWSNFYGDPVPWSVQKSGIYSFLSFLNVAKYPPSLCFCLVTLGCMFLLLALAEYQQHRVTRVLCTYGRAPLFYFVVHFYLIHTLLLVLLLAQGIAPGRWEFATGSFGRPRNIISGIPLGAVYLVWIAVVAAMYLPCAWYARYRAAHARGLLRYF